MATNYPPDGIEVSGGDTAWPTDIDQDTTVYKTGDSSVKFKNTTPSADPAIVDQEYYPCAAGDLFRGDIWLRADSIAGGNQMRFVVQWYNGALGYVGASTIFDNTLAAINTWEFYSTVITAPATAGYFRYYIQKDNTAFNGWADSAEINRMPYAFLAYRNANQINMLAAGSYIQYNAEEYDYGSGFDLVNYDYTCQAGGIYSFHARAWITDLDVDEYAYLTLRHSVNNWAAFTTIGWGNHFFSRIANWTPTVTLNYIGFLSAGDQLRVVLVHGHAANATVRGAAGGAGASLYTVFGGAKVE